MDLKRIITQHYGLVPKNIKQLTAKTHMLSKNNQKFIFKKSKTLTDNLSLWKKVYQFALKEGIPSVLPIYLTKSEMFYVKKNHHVFYLSPYISSKKISIKKVYQALGQFHYKSLQEKIISFNEFKNQLTAFQNHCQKNKRELLFHIENFEKKQYMSPFELQVCTHYRDLKEVFIHLEKRIQELLNIEEEKINWNLSLCHGNLVIDHILFDQNPYFYNWEKAQYQNAIMDLVSLLKSAVLDLHLSEEKFITYFNDYLQANPLTSLEYKLLAIHLLNPQPYLEKIKGYALHDDSSSMLKNTKEIERFYHQLIFAFNFIKKTEDLLESPDSDHEKI